MDLDLDPQSDVQPAIDLDLDPDMQPAMDLDLDPHPGVQPGPRSPLPSPSGRPCAAPRPTGPHSAQTAGQAAREGSSRRPKQGQGQGQSQGQGQRRSASSKLGNPPSSRSQGEPQARGRSPGVVRILGQGGEGSKRRVCCLCLRPCLHVTASCPTACPLAACCALCGRSCATSCPPRPWGASVAGRRCAAPVRRSCS